MSHDFSRRRFLKKSCALAGALAAGYRGYFSMEWEGQGEPFAGTQNLIQQSLECLA